MLKFAPPYDTSDLFTTKRGRPKNIEYPKYEFDSKETECFYCGIPIFSETRTRDHVFPRIKGGILCNGNKVWSCKKCNSYKGNFTIPEFCDKLKKMIGMKRYESKKELFEKILIKVEFMKSKLYPDGN